MVRGAALALAALACACAQASVLVPTYVLPPDTFVRDQRSSDDQHTADSQRTIRRLVGGHMRIDRNKSFGDPAKNSFATDEKTESGKFAGVFAPDKASASVGWDQGVWDDGMLMSSAGEGKETTKGKDDDEDKKTLADQVAEGKYGLIQNEIFQKTPKRPGVVSYESNPETREKDNVHTLGGLSKEEIWLAEDHLLVLKGGSFAEHGHESERKPWPAIDDYEAPRRQVKLPQKPLVPPPFPVRLSDDGPLVFLTPNGSFPASLFPPFPAGAGYGPLPPAPFPFPPGFNPESSDSRNATSGGAPYPIPPFPFVPGNSSEGGPFPPFLFPASMNGSFPEGFPPGAAFLPPPGNQTDLYDEDDPSIYYPPPYNFSYHAEKKGSVPPGPLVPGIVLPPPPDFFAPLEERTTTTEESTTRGTPKPKPIAKRPQTPGYRKPLKTRPTTDNVRTTIDITTPRPIIVAETPKQRQPPRIVQIPRPTPVRTYNYAHEEPVGKPSPIEKPTYKPRQKTTPKPTSAPVSIAYDYPEDQAYNNKLPSTSPKSYEVYGPPEQTNDNGNSIVTSTPVPLRGYYTNTQKDDYPKTELKPVYSPKQNDNSLASFYFYDEQPKTTPASAAYFDGRTYYKTVPISPNQNTRLNPSTQSGFTPSVNVAYGSIDQSDNLLIWPQKQGPRTLTQEYFSIQKPKAQQVYVQNARPDSFYHQIADIQQTIDFYTTNRPNQYVQRPNVGYKQRPATARPVYQFSYQNKPRQEQITFRAPKLDTEPFRPMVSYSKPFNVDSEYNTIPPSQSPVHHQQYLVENSKATTETPTSSKYYPKSKPKQEDYDETPVKYDNDGKSGYANPKVPQRVQIVKSIEQFPSTTPSALSHGYYTKQDERYVDDITRNYFELFGKKIEDTHDANGLAVTPPLDTVRTPINNGINLQYANDESENYRPNPPSLAGDTLVNFRRPRPYIEPESEFVPIANPAYQQFEQIQRQILREQQAQQQAHRQAQQQAERASQPRPAPTLPPYTGEQLDLFRPAPPQSLAGDIAVNYNRPLPPINPDAELVEPVNSAGEGRPGSFVSYRLPGEGAHVYFLTPQASRDRYGYRPRGSGR